MLLFETMWEKKNRYCDYTGYADFQDYTQNGFSTDYADCADIQHFVKNVRY